MSKRLNYRDVITIQSKFQAHPKLSVKTFISHTGMQLEIPEQPGPGVGYQPLSEAARNELVYLVGFASFCQQPRDDNKSWDSRSQPQKQSQALLFLFSRNFFFLAEVSFFLQNYNCASFSLEQQLLCPVPHRLPNFLSQLSVLFC